MCIIFLKIIYLLAMLDLHCCSVFSLVADSAGYSLVVHGFLIAVTSLAAEYWFNKCSAWA